MTAEEFGRKHAGEHVEYINGEVKEVPMAGGKHGKICYRAGAVNGQFVDANQLGHMFTNDTFVKVPTRDDPERVYGADVCFISYERLPKDAEVPDGVLPVTPNLVVEVRSPTDTWTKVFGKVVDYLGVGVPVVLLIDPNTRTASVYGEPFGQRTFNSTETLTIPEVLPGFAAEVKKFFE
jgi:Uma2 family endonuclease